MWNPRLSFAGLLAAAATAQAQDCLWTSHAVGPRWYGQAVYHSGLQRVLFLATGGYSLTNLAIWSWDGTAWTQLSSDGPTVRSSAGLAYDSARDRLVLFGGYYGNSSLAETWEWDRTTWTQSPVAGPSSRAGPGLAYDQSRHRTVLFGGYFYSSPTLTYLGDTWEWDGQAWTQVATTGPSPRSVGCIAYDSLRARTMIFGNVPNTSTMELWEWDGAAWLQRPASGPTQYATWMVYDPVRARMIVGHYPGNYPFETWELEPATAAWTLRDPGTGPLGPAAFDVARSRAVVLNGPSSSTMEYNGAATIVPPSIMHPPQGQDVIFGHPAVFYVQAGGTAVTYQWRHDGLNLSNGGSISGVTTDTLTIDPVGNGDAGAYDVVLSNSCATITTSPVQLGVSPACYPNCDNSTTPPYLNVNDFACFLNKFAAGDTYANCTGGCNPPPCLNVLDFACFLNRFVAGCSSP